MELKAHVGKRIKRKSRRGPKRLEFYDRVADLVRGLTGDKVLSLEIPKERSLRSFQSNLKEAMSLRGVEVATAYNYEKNLLEVSRQTESEILKSYGR